MGGFKAVEDRPTPREVYNARIYISAILIAWGALTFGYDSAFLGTTIARQSFKDAFGITKMTAKQVADTSSNITSTFQAAAFFGSLFSWLIMENFGRKPTLQISAFIFNIGAIIMTVATHQLSMIYAGRALTGIAVGGITAVVPSYIAEQAPNAIRGQLTGMFEIAYQIGAVIGFWINYGVGVNIPASSTASWRIPMAVQLIPGGMLAIGTVFLKESPQFLIRKGKREQGIASLCYLRKLPEDATYIQEELEMIDSRIADELAVAGEGRGVWGYVKGAFRELALPGIRNRIVLVFCMFMLQNFSGANAINYYSPTLFKSIGITNVNLYTGIYGLVKAISSIVFYIFFIDLFGRRNPWMLSAGLCCLCLIYVGAFVKIGHPDSSPKPLSPSTKKGGDAATAMIMLYSIFWAFGGNGLPWIVSAEIFPLRLRSLTGAYASMCQWLAQFVITKSTPSIFLAMGWGTFIFFAAIYAKFGYHPHMLPTQRPMGTPTHAETASQEGKEKDIYRETV